MKTKERKIYSPKKLFLVIIFSLVFLFGGLVGISSALTNHPVSGTLSVSPTTVHIGEPITISITGQDDDGLIRFEIYYQSRCLYRENVSGISATRTWTITEDSAATYRYQGRVVGVDLDPSTHTGWVFGEEESVSTGYKDVIVLDSTFSSCTNECSYSGQTRCYSSTRKQICGQHDSDSCLEWSSPISCSVSTSCGYRTCDDDERPTWRCSGGNCTYTCNYSSSCVSSCECSDSSRPCCDGCHYRPSTWICDFETQTQYGCPWGLGCGADTAKRTKTRYKYCSGNSSQCTGSWHNWLPWTDWKISDSCSSNEVCIVGNSQCQYSSNCVTYTKEYRKDCYDNDVYWFDSNGKRQDKYQECSDDNPCTIDGCENKVCFNTLKSDGTTCEIGSLEYCESCEHCGDNICNCEENNDTCSEDCKAALAQGLEKGKAAVGLTLKSLLKKWYIWLLLGIAAILLLYWLFKRPKE